LRKGQPPSAWASRDITPGRNRNRVFPPTPATSGPNRFRPQPSPAPARVRGFLSPSMAFLSHVGHMRHVPVIGMICTRILPHLRGAAPDLGSAPQDPKGQSPQLIRPSPRALFTSPEKDLFEEGATSERLGFPGHHPFATGSGSFRPLPPPRVLTGFGRSNPLLRLEAEAFYPPPWPSCRMSHAACARDSDDMHSNSATLERGLPPDFGSVPQFPFPRMETPLRDPRHQPPNQVYAGRCTAHPTGTFPTHLPTGKF
jgi:hypothetical protein